MCSLSLANKKKLIEYQVDAFSNNIFSGNPAAVCLLEGWLSDEIMLSIAMENNLSETAFVIVQPDALCHIRWFTPLTEVELCGHATLAAAFVVLEFVRPDLDSLRFSSAGGDLHVHREQHRYFLNFPALGIVPWSDMQTILMEGLQTGEQCEVFKSHYDAFVVFETPDSIRRLQPNFQKLREIDVRGIIVTSCASEVDFVSRFFAPRVGIDEDPVTGSAHSVLIPYWGQRLQKRKLVAQQLSRRGGMLYCEDLCNGRVEIGGDAVLFSRAEIFLPE